MVRIVMVLNQSILLGSALVGYFNAASVSFQRFASNPLTLLVPTFSSLLAPALCTVSNERPALVRKSFARSQLVNFDHGPTKMWKLHSDVSVVSVTLFCSWNATRSGFTETASIWKSGM